MGMAKARNESNGNYFNPISGPIASGPPDSLPHWQNSFVKAGT